MKKQYEKPIAKKITYEYDERVVASGKKCSGEIRVFTEPSVNTCSQYRMNDYPKTMSLDDPCAYSTPIV